MTFLLFIDPPSSGTGTGRLVIVRTYTLGGENTPPAIAEAIRLAISIRPNNNLLRTSGQPLQPGSTGHLFRNSDGELVYTGGVIRINGTNHFVPCGTFRGNTFVTGDVRPHNEAVTGGFISSTNEGRAAALNRAIEELNLINITDQRLSKNVRDQLQRDAEAQIGANNIRGRRIFVRGFINNGVLTRQTDLFHIGRNDGGVESPQLNLTPRRRILASVYYSHPTNPALRGISWFARAADTSLPSPARQQNFQLQNPIIDLPKN